MIEHGRVKTRRAGRSCSVTIMIQGAVLLPRYGNISFSGPEYPPPNNEYLVKGHDPYQVAGYSLSSPALADGHVYYGSWNGHVYCFGDSYVPPVSTTTTVNVYYNDDNDYSYNNYGQ